MFVGLLGFAGLMLICAVLNFFFAMWIDSEEGLKVAFTCFILSITVTIMWMVKPDTSTRYQSTVLIDKQ